MMVSSRSPGDRLHAALPVDLAVLLVAEDVAQPRPHQAGALQEGPFAVEVVARRGLGPFGPEHAEEGGHRAVADVGVELLELVLGDHVEGVTGALEAVDVRTEEVVEVLDDQVGDPVEGQVARCWRSRPRW